MVGSEPAGVDGNTGAANNAAEHIGKLVSELDAALDAVSYTHLFACAMDEAAVISGVLRTKEMVFA